VHGSLSPPGKDPTRRRRSTQAGAEEDDMKQSKRAHSTPKDITRSRHGLHAAPHALREADLARTHGGTAATPSNGGANGTDHWI
jgi:hypothetical protein